MRVCPGQQLTGNHPQRKHIRLRVVTNKTRNKQREWGKIRLTSNHLWAHVIPAPAKKWCETAEIKKKNMKTQKQWKHENSVPAKVFVCTIDPTNCFDNPKSPQQSTTTNTAVNKQI
jgi:hypothetical protein